MATFPILPTPEDHAGELRRRKPPQTHPAPRELPDYLPARMVKEFVYCPRLFYYEWVDNVFADNAETLDGAHLHRRVDKPSSAPLPTAEELDQDDSLDEKIHSRSVTLSSETHRLIAKMDLLDIANGIVTPVDYKRGKPRIANKETGEIELWPADRVQLAVQAIVLRDNGYTVAEGVLFYASTRQRVRVPFDDALIAEALAAAQMAWETARSWQIPPPLQDSPKCPGCSLVGICLPDETNALQTTPASGASLAPVDDVGAQLSLFDFTADDGTPRKPPASSTPVRPLVTPRTELKPLYLNTQGLRVGRSQDVLQVKDKDKIVQEVRIREVNQINLLGNIQITTQALQTLFESEIPVCFFSQGGWFYGIAAGLNTKNVFLRRTQFRLADQDPFCLKLSRQLTSGKIRNQRTLLQRNHIEPPAAVLRRLKELADDAETANSLETLLGIEGYAARLYFGEFSQMLKAGEAGDEPSPFSFDFDHRNRRPPRDPVNAVLSLAYSMLAKDLTIACSAVGFDPMIGFYHQPRFGRPALALDLMEPFRPLIADSAVLSAINTRMISPADFIQAGPSVALTPSGRKAFYRAYELRMDSLITHPLFEYRVSYRRLLEIQTRLLARYLQGEIDTYPVFLTR